jgi:hypothetical protein
MNVERPIDGVAEALPPGSDARGDIDDEIGDHLALAARDLQLAGHASDEARRLAMAKFGDVEQVRRRCWWIQQGDAFMARAALGLAIAVLILAVVGLAIGGWRMNSAINDLGDTLAAINETQKELLNRKPEPLLTPTPTQELTVNGRLYVGDKPARHADVYLFDLANDQLIDHLYADEEGRFVSKPLTPGPYFVLAPLVGKENPNVRHGDRPFLGKTTPLFAIQSEPISVYPWSKKRNVEIDVKMFPMGELSFELNRPFPTPFESGEGESKLAVTPRLVINVPGNFQHEPLPATNDWQTEGEYAPVSWVIGHSVVERTGIVPEMLLPQGIGGGLNNPVAQAGASRETGAAGSNSEKADMLGPFLVSRWRAGSSLHDLPHAFPEGEYEVAAFLTNAAWISSFSNDELPAEARKKIKVIGGERTHLRISLPDNFEESIRAAIKEAGSDAKKLEAAVSKRYPATIAVVGQEVLVKELPNEGRRADGRGFVKTAPAH